MSPTTKGGHRAKLTLPPSRLADDARSDQYPSLLERQHLGTVCDGHIAAHRLLPSTENTDEVLTVTLDAYEIIK